MGGAITWSQTGTPALDMDDVQSTEGRMGDSVDFRRASGVIPRKWLMVLNAEMDAPTAGGTIEVYLAPSVDDAVFPGGVTGSDADYKNGDEAEWKKQLGAPVLVLVVTADAANQYAFAEVTISARYGAPVIINLTDADFEDTAAGVHASTLTMYPLSDFPLD